MDNEINGVYQVNNCLLKVFKVLIFIYKLFLSKAFLQTMFLSKDVFKIKSKFIKINITKSRRSYNLNQ